MYNPPLHSTLITNMAPDGGFMRVFEEFRIPNREFINNQMNQMCFIKYYVNN